MLKASHLTRRFDSRVAVDDLSFTLAPGEIFALLGPNGAGKTTTLRMLAGLIAPTSGTVHVNGELMTAAASHLRGRIGFLTEAPGLWDRLTVHDNLVVYARLQGVEPVHKKVAEALELFGIANRAGDQTAQLSKGLKQRVALARTLLHDPPIVLLDEPTAGLDPESAHETRALILRLRTEQRSVVISTHNLDEVERVADRVAVLRSRLVAVGTPGELRQRLFTTRLRIRLGDAAEPYAAILRRAGLPEVRAEGVWLTLAAATRTTPEIVRTLVEAGAGIEAVEHDEPSLEDVYIKVLRSDSDVVAHPGASWE